MCVCVCVVDLLMNIFDLLNQVGDSPNTCLPYFSRLRTETSAIMFCPLLLWVNCPLFFLFVDAWCESKRNTKVKYFMRKNHVHLNMFGFSYMWYYAILTFTKRNQKCWLNFSETFKVYAESTNDHSKMHVNVILIEYYSFIVVSKTY